MIIHFHRHSTRYTPRSYDSLMAKLKEYVRTVSVTDRATKDMEEYMREFAGLSKEIGVRYTKTTWEEPFTKIYLDDYYRKYRWINEVCSVGNHWLLKGLYK